MLISTAESDRVDPGETGNHKLDSKGIKIIYSKVSKNKHHVFAFSTLFCAVPLFEQPIDCLHRAVLYAFDSNGANSSMCGLQSGSELQVLAESC